MLNLPIQFASLQNPYCFSTWQTLLSDLSAAQFVTFPANFSVYNFGPTTPTPENRAYPWRRTRTNGNPAGNWVFSQGVWLMEHPLYDVKQDTVTRALMMWEGASGDVAALDGGDTGTTEADVTDTSGPMWLEVAEYAARMPIAAGTLTSGTALAVAATGGEEKHTLTIAEMPLHDHGLVTNSRFVRQTPQTLDVGAGASYGLAQFLAEGGDQPHNNMPPFFVIRILRKSLRRFYRLDP